ncbi:MAG: tetratricopeptide repeat protein [Anaerolineales bacterium]|nr:tetratricopeptide repeat protein [Anaerolineales bacterium]
MMASANIVNVSESNFEYEVLQYSRQAPVLVDFWAEWCIPCRTLEPLLVRLAEEAQGAFRLARLNVDQNQRLAEQLAVRSIPVIKIYRAGAVVAEFSGLQDEAFVREFLRRVLPGPLDLSLEKLASLLQLGRWPQAEETARQVLKAQPGQPVAMLGLGRALLAQGQAGDALDLLERFPPSAQYKSAQTLLPLARALACPASAIEVLDNPLAALYGRALALARKGNFAAAMDGLLEVLRQQRRYRDDEARQVMVAIFELLGDENELTRQYRRELATVLY